MGKYKKPIVATVAELRRHTTLRKAHDKKRWHQELLIMQIVQQFNLTTKFKYLIQILLVVSLLKIAVLSTTGLWCYRERESNFDLYNFWKLISIITFFITFVNVYSFNLYCSISRWTQKRAQNNQLFKKWAYPCISYVWMNAALSQLFVCSLLVCITFKAFAMTAGNIVSV